MNRSWPAGIAAGAALAALVLTFRTRAETAAPVAPAPARDFAKTLAGNPSCSARGCHGRLEPVPGQRVQQNEFLSWTLHDKHARAYEVLKSERAARMAENLAPTNDGGKVIPAHEDARCLACHATPQLATAEKTALRHERLADGVSCEACHGAAAGGVDWLQAHYGAGWAKLTPEEKHQHGMTPLGDLAVQAQTCAGCHVGAPPDEGKGVPARDLNHDLMAAGHPRLTFELGSYRVNMPPHWLADKDKKADPGYEARAWAVGQAEAARASLELLAYRAGKPERPWPEFAEADCFACHADLRPRSRDWRANPAYYKGRKPGAVPYCEWYSAVLPALPASGPAAQAYKQLRDTMNKSNPDAKRAADQARAAAELLKALSAEAKGARYDSAAVEKMLAAATAPAGDPEKSKVLTWDQVTQIALGVAALRQAARDLGAPAGASKLDALFGDLAYPPGYESPHTFRRDEGKLESELIQLLPRRAP
jgi:hypothetical protein